MSSVVVIRCTEFSGEVAQLHSELAVALPGAEIWAVVDLLNQSSEDANRVLESFEIPVLGLTRDFVEQNQLHFRGNNTGWSCGDYVLYRAMERSWDHIWVVEPDLKFVNGAEALLAEWDEGEEDLITSYCHGARSDWYWLKSMQALWPGVNIYISPINIARLSRKLVEATLSKRQSFTPEIKNGKAVPNDEAVIATTAKHGEFAIRELAAEYDELFEFWSTTEKYSVAGISELYSGPKIVHGALSGLTLRKWVDKKWSGIERGVGFDLKRLQTTVDSMTRAELVDFIKRASDRQFGIRTALSADVDVEKITILEQALVDLTEEIPWSRVWRFAESLVVFDLGTKYGLCSFEILPRKKSVSIYLLVRQKESVVRFEASDAYRLAELQKSHDEYGRFLVSHLQAPSLYAEEVELEDERLRELADSLIRVASLLK